MLHKLFSQPEIRPAEPALFISGAERSYEELGRRINAFISLVERHHPVAGGLIGVVDHADLDTYAAVLAVLCAGHAYVPINPRNPAARTISVLQQTGATLLFDSKPGALDEVVERLPNISLIRSTEVPSAGSPLLAPRAATKDSLAYVLFTSGSTGIPKGVPITRGNLDAFLEGLLALVDIEPRDRVLQMFDLTFDFSVMSLFAPLVAGACVCPAAGGDHRFMSVYRLLAEHGISCAPMVPSVLNFLRPYFADIRLESLRSAVFCGEALLADITLEWAACAPNMRVFNFYGPTEATVFCSCYEWRRDSVKEVNGVLSIGKPMKHAVMFVVDDLGRIAQPRQAGELCITGAQLTPGYWQDPQKTAASFFEIEIDGTRVRAYRTGDGALVDDEGDFMYIGRLDNQVKVQGFRIELGEVEHYARACAEMDGVAAVDVVNDTGMVELVLCVAGLKGSVRELQEALRARMPAYMVPARVAAFESLPLNSNGKVDRPALRRQVTALRA